MSQKPNKKNKREAERQKQNESLKGALWVLGVGCLAEIYLLMMRKFFINGTLEQVVAWDGYLGFAVYVGIALTMLGAGVAFINRKVSPMLKNVGIALAVFGVFVGLSSWLVRNYVTTALTPLCFIVPVVMVLGILWCLYDRECGYSLMVLGATVLVLWICRKGVGTTAWNTLALGCASLFVITAALTAAVFVKAEKNKGVAHGVRLLPEGGKALPVIASCAASVLAVLVGMFSATAAFYAMWVVGLAIFVLAVYYTVKQL